MNSNLKQSIKIYESRLLDISFRNKLINYKFNFKNQIRIINENPENLYDNLKNNKQLKLKSLWFQDYEPNDEKTNEFKTEFEFLLSEEYGEKDISLKEKNELKDKL